MWEHSRKCKNAVADDLTLHQHIFLFLFFLLFSEIHVMLGWGWGCADWCRPQSAPVVSWVVQLPPPFRRGLQLTDESCCQQWRLQSSTTGQLQLSAWSEWLPLVLLEHKGSMKGTEAGQSFFVFFIWMIRSVFSNGSTGPLHGPRTAHNHGAKLTARGRKRAAVGRRQKSKSAVSHLRSVACVQPPSCWWSCVEIARGSRRSRVFTSTLGRCTSSWFRPAGLFFRPSVYYDMREDDLGCKD